MSGTLNAGYLDALHMAHPRFCEFSLLIDGKKKLDSQKRGLLSFGEIAVGRAPQVRDWGCEEPLALDPIKREGRGRTLKVVITYRP